MSFLGYMAHCSGHRVVRSLLSSLQTAKEAWDESVD